MQILGEFKGSGVDFLLCYLKSSLVTVQMHKVLVRQLKYVTKKEKSYRCRYSSVAYQRFYWKYSSLPNDSKKKRATFHYLIGLQLISLDLVPN